jgi:predicted transposase YbfD/YdcC
MWRLSALRSASGPSPRSQVAQLICDGKTLRDSIESTAGGGSAFIGQLTLYTAAVGVAISQACYATGENHERVVLRQLLGELDLEGVLIQADALHTQKPFSATPGAGGRLPATGVVKGFSEGVSQPEVTPPPDPQSVPGKVQDPFPGNRSRNQPRSQHHLDAAGQTGPRAHS